jgi:hypothetical protein
LKITNEFRDIEQSGKYSDHEIEQLGIQPSTISTKEEGEANKEVTPASSRSSLVSTLIIVKL